MIPKTKRLKHSIRSSLQVQSIRDYIYFNMGGIERDAMENMPCDNTGYCSMSCSRYGSGCESNRLCH